MDRSSGPGRSTQGHPVADVTVGSLSLELGEQRQVYWGGTPTSQESPSCDPPPPAVLGHTTQAACRAQVCPALPVPGHLHLADTGAQLRHPVKCPLGSPAPMMPVSLLVNWSSLFRTSVRKRAANFGGTAFRDSTIRCKEGGVEMSRFFQGSSQKFQSVRVGSDP